MAAYDSDWALSMFVDPDDDVVPAKGVPGNVDDSGAADLDRPCLVPTRPKINVHYKQSCQPRSIFAFGERRAGRSTARKLGSPRSCSSRWWSNSGPIAFRRSRPVETVLPVCVYL